KTPRPGDISKPASGLGKGIAYCFKTAPGLPFRIPDAHSFTVFSDWRGCAHKNMIAYSDRPGEPDNRFKGAAAGNILPFRHL
ncbi:MAG TPA: hypothetical protein VD713_04150, partial [Sphingomonadales bacterium]|nr:hypothetical protein [Sphingomonadales bacterium]